MAEFELDLEAARIALIYYMGDREDLIPRRLWNEIERLFFSDFRNGFDLPLRLDARRLTDHLIDTLEHLKTGLITEDNTDPAIDFGHSIALILSAIRRHKQYVLALRLDSHKFIDLVLEALSDKREFLTLIQKRIK